MALFDTIRQMWRKTPSPDEVDTSDMEIPNNPSGKEFLDAVKHSIRKTIDKYSITQNTIKMGSEDSEYAVTGSSTPFGSSGIINPGSDIDSSFASTTLGLAVPVDTNKMMRLQSYDNIARYPELDWCINEIANDFIHTDCEGNFLKLRFKCEDGKYGEGGDKIVMEEFNNLVSKLDLRSNGYNMMRKFLIEGEICFENVIDPAHKDFGIIGFKYIPNVFYDFLRDRTTGQTCGLYIDPEKMKMFMQYGAFGGTANSYRGQSSTVFNAMLQVPAYSYTYSQGMQNKVVMPWEQVTYMNSGVLSEDGSIVFPHIEKVVVPVRQLLLMHDAMIILRITRAPEKLLFNIDMTGMQPREAKNYVRKFVEQRNSKKAITGSGAVTNVYNAETMLDAYYFWKTSESSGTSVQNLSTTSHYNEFSDVEYFLRRILKFLNIPWARWQESQANRQDKNSVTNEEFSFAKMVVRFQQMFASAVKKTFITHLRLRGLFDKFDVHESDFEVTMIPPSFYETFQAEQRFADFTNVMNGVAGLQFISKNMVLKKMFGWTDADIKENEVNSRREMLRDAQTQFMAQMVGAAGTPTGGKVWLDPEKYINPPPIAPTGTDTQGQQPTVGGGTPPNGGMSPQMPNGGMGASGQPPIGGNGELPNDIPDPRVYNDDSDISDAEKELDLNPEFGDFEEKYMNTLKYTDKQYPETDVGVEALEQDRPVTMSDTFDTVFRDDSDKTMHELFDDAFSSEDDEKTLGEIFDDEFGDIQKERKSSLHDIFNDIVGKEKESKSEKLLTNTFKDIFIRKTK